MIASFDGACEPYDPGGHMGLGWVIDGQPHCEYIPAAGENTSNVAEYLALTKVFQYAISAGPSTLTITGDSRLIITQLNGQYTVRPRSVDRHHLVAASLLYRIRQSRCTVDLIWVPRSQNVTADKVSHDALAEKGIEPPRRKPAPGWTTRLEHVSKELGISSGTLGGILNGLGLRRMRKPSERALVEGYARTRFNGSRVSVDWDINKVIELVRSSTEYGAVRLSKEAERAARKTQTLESLTFAMYTASALRERGWTRSQLKAHPPDLVIPPNKTDTLAEPIRQRFWKQSRIKLIEAQQEWKLRPAELNAITLAEHGPGRAAAPVKRLGKPI
jgi:ribonuclease HI